MFVLGSLLINLFKMNIRMDERVPLSKLQIIEEQTSPTQRKAKIYSRKLPEDFFLQRSLANSSNRNQMHTQGIPRRLFNIERVSNTRETGIRPGNLSGRGREEDRAIDLMKGVIDTSREMRKMIRRHSL